jgi:uncharacterized protein YdhG (YjbR/CyaY superfamily)
VVTGLRPFQAERTSAASSKLRGTIAPLLVIIARMKKANPSTRGSSTKGRSAPPSKTVEDYLAAVPEPAHSTLQRMRAAIRSVVPAEATEAISYGMPAFKYKGTLVWFAAFSDHCSLFPTASVIKAFKNELKDYRTSKGTIHFPVDKPLPAALVKKMVKMRLAETQKKQR